MNNKLVLLYNRIIKYNPLGAFVYLYRQNKQLKKDLYIWKVGKWEPGHFYTPHILKDQIETDNSVKIFKELGGIILKEKEQIELLEVLFKYYSNLKLPETKMAGYRYYLQNGYFNNSDAIFLSLIMLHFRPKRIIEVGSGFSSALMLDINDRMGDDKANLIFVEPFPERLRQLISNQDNCILIEDYVQNTDPAIYSDLEANDILFVDSSHVSKHGSDVNHIVFNILPLLKPGVIIHFHDIFYPFDYPAEWLRQGRFWNEAYLLRAFLQFNNDFEILLFPSMLEMVHKEWFDSNMQLCLVKAEKRDDRDEYIDGIFGKSIYLRRKTIS